ncbi:hypothetical protein T09_5485 [Trichinella sp. T9]|nr:hypothetical protein T09_5485 [Trichinella sp. T9]
MELIPVPKPRDSRDVVIAKKNQSWFISDETKAVVTYPPDPVLLKLALFGRICGFETIYCSWTKKFSELNGVGNLGEDAARAIMECHPSS